MDTARKTQCPRKLSLPEHKEGLEHNVRSVIKKFYQLTVDKEKKLYVCGTSHLFFIRENVSTQICCEFWLNLNKKKFCCFSICHLLAPIPETVLGKGRHILVGGRNVQGLFPGFKLRARIRLRVKGDLEGVPFTHYFRLRLLDSFWIPISLAKICSVSRMVINRAKILLYWEA